MRSALFILMFSLFIISNGKTQILKDKKNTYRAIGCYIERMNADNFNYEDNDIKFTIIPNYSWSWIIRIENKTKQNMTIIWDKALFIINQQSAGFLFYTQKSGYLSYPAYDETIAPISYIEKECSTTLLRGGFMYDTRKIKRTGLDSHIRLVFPIKVNGELKTYEFKYRIYLINQKKQKKALEKTMKKMFKEAQKETEQS